MSAKIPAGALGLALVALATACVSTVQPKRLLDLDVPVYAWHVETSSCGSLQVVDGQGRLWNEHGCEGTSSGFVRGRTLSSKEQQAIASAFAKFPSTTQPCNMGEASVNIFTSRIGNVQKTWRLCPSDTRAPLPEPFASVAGAFQRLR